MKVAPTLDGGLRIDAESTGDWDVLRSLVTDAVTRGGDLATRLGNLIEGEEDSEDWKEFVVPELRTRFDHQLATVVQAVENAADAVDQGPGPLAIPREQAEDWYGALNQARLALEERHRFHESPDLAPQSMSPPKRSAWFRSHFYMALQGLLLDHVMNR